GSPIITGRRLHIDLVEEASPQEIAVGRAVERHSARQSETAQPSSGPEVSAEVHHRSVETGLERSRHIPMLISYFTIRPALLNQMHIQMIPSTEIVLTLVSGPVQS